jgi:hypothetical protein
MSKRAICTGAVLLLCLCTGFARPSAALDLGKTASSIKRAFGVKPADPPPRVGAGERAARARAAKANKAANGPSRATGTPVTAAEPDTALVPPATTDEILLSPEPYVYQSIARRDPFVSLVGDDYLMEHAEEALSLADFSVRGILWGERDRFALIEGLDGSSLILREGDRLGPYSISRIEPEAVLVYISEYGVGRTERLVLTEGKGNRNERVGR